MAATRLCLWQAKLQLSYLAMCTPHHPSPHISQVFDRATKHPNATVVSWAAPRVVLIRDFLSPAEVAHLERQARGEGCGGSGGVDACRGTHCLA